MPLAQACDWVRQAALGLQHAHERGMVHRDIKPHNLLLTRQGVVKILDMGLARMGPSGEDGEASTTMTQEGVVMGTPDFMAPEQTLDAHRVDVRADLYSLGCTLYYLLAGKVPFPGGSLGEKIAKHQAREPVPVERRRPDVPPAVAAVVRKLMAKRPEDRYQTPAELARALEAPAGEDSRTIPAAPRAEMVSAPGGQTTNGALDFRPSGETVQGMRAERRSHQTARRRKTLLAAVGGGVLLLALGVALWLLFGRSGRSRPEARPVAREQAAEQKKEPRSFEQWLHEVADLPAEKQVEAVAAELKRRNPRFEGRVAQTMQAGTVLPGIADGEVTSLELRSNEVTDVSPLRALPGLKHLAIWGVVPGRGKFEDLAQLKGLPLLSLTVAYTDVRDLSALTGMPLTHVSCGGIPVTDLSPLRGMPLTALYCNETGVADLSPLKGAP